MLHKAGHPRLGIQEELGDELHTIRLVHQNTFPDIHIDEPSDLHDALTQSADYQLVRERFARIASEILNRWGSPEAISYLDDLLHYKEAGNLEGFPPEIHAALMRILMLHDTHFPRA